MCHAAIGSLPFLRAVVSSTSPIALSRSISHLTHGAEGHLGAHGESGVAWTQRMPSALASRAAYSGRSLSSTADQNQAPGPSGSCVPPPVQGGHLFESYVIHCAPFQPLHLHSLLCRCFSCVCGPQSCPGQSHVEGRKKSGGICPEVRV